MTVEELVEVFDENLRIAVWERNKDGYNTDLVKFDSRYKNAIKDDVLGRIAFHVNIKTDGRGVDIFVRPEP